MTGVQTCALPIFYISVYQSEADPAHLADLGLRLDLRAQGSWSLGNIIVISNLDSGNKLKIWTSNLKYEHTPNDPVQPRPASSNKLGSDFDLRMPFILQIPCSHVVVQLQAI